MRAIAKPKTKEHDEQVVVARWARLQEVAYPELKALFAVPNGGQRNPATAQRLKAEGVRAGVPDLFLPAARGGAYGLFVELKVGKNRPTPEQLEMHELLRAQGYVVSVCWGADEAISAIKKYLEG